MGEDSLRQTKSIKEASLTPETPAPHNPEPGAKQDNMGHFGFGPGVTPFEDLSTSVFFILGAGGMGFFALLPELQGNGAWIFWLGSLGFVAGAVYTTQRGIRRWRWRLANIDLTGGIYLRPWQKTPHHNE